MTAEAEQVVARLTAGGKSELQRARRSVTQSPGDGKESATERETAPFRRGKGEKVSRFIGICPLRAEGKSSPVFRVTGTARKTPPGARPNRFRFERGPLKFLKSQGGGTGKAARPCNECGAKMNDHAPVNGRQNSAYGLLRQFKKTPAGALRRAVWTTIN